jgi:RNA polymerase sigma factor (sigma-70 family)
MGVDAEALLEQAGWMRRLAERLVRDPDRAEDMAQETWRIALERQPSFAESPRGWVKSVMQNLARRSHRDEATRAYHEHRSARPEAIGPEDETEERVLLQKRLADAILALDEPYRSAIRLRYIDGRSPREVAREQGITYEAARRRLSRAVAMLRERLDRAYGNRAAWGAACIALLKKSGPVAAAIAVGSFMSAKLVLMVAALIGVALVGVGLWRDTHQAKGQSGVQASRSVLAQPAGTGTAPEQRDSANAATREAIVAPPSAPPAHAIDRVNDLTGTVIDPRGNAVRGASVVIFDEVLGDFAQHMQQPQDRVRVTETRTEADGGFAVTLPRGRPFDIEVRGAGYPTERVMARYAGERVLVRLHRPAALTGRIRRAADHTPVIDADVYLKPSTLSESDLQLTPLTAIVPMHTRTDDDGRYRFESLAPGRMRVEVVPDHDPPPRIVELDVDEGSERSLDVEVDEGMTLRGAVIDSRTRRPIEGAVVWRDHLLGFPRREVRTDAMGQFTVTGFPVQRDLTYVNGVELLLAGAPGYALGTALVGRRGGALAQFVEIELDPAKRARGRVLDSDGRPLAGAYVAVERQMRPDSPSHSIRTRDDGTFEVGEIENTLAFWFTNDVKPADANKPAHRSANLIQHWLFVRAQGFATYSANLPKSEHERETVDFGDIVLAPAASFSGRVVDETQRGLADILVMLWPTDNGWDRERTARTDEFGRFGMTDLPAGDYFLAATRFGGRRVEQTVHITPGERVEGVWLTLPAGESIEGYVLDEDGRGASGMRVFAVRQDEPHNTSTASCDTDAKGHFMEQGLEPGTYNLNAMDQFSMRYVEVQDCASPLYAGNTIEGVRSGDRNVVLNVKSRAHLHGVVLDADGRIVQGATVWACDARGRRLDRARTDEDGGFDLSMPATPAIKVCARAHGDGDADEPASDAIARQDSEACVELDAVGSRRLSLRLPRKP